MEGLQHFLDTSVWYTIILIILVIWEIVWKLIGMWRAARNNHVVWFICIAIINTLGILPIVYLSISKKKTAKKK